MKLQFDSSQSYQLDAIQAVIDVFEGQPLADSDFQITIAANRSGLAFTDTGIANQLLISEGQILENVKKIQTKFNDVNRYDDADGKEKYISYIEPTNEI